MANSSVWHWTILILLPIIYLVPAARILRKAGFSGWLCLLLLVPVVNLLMYWVFAFVRWPVEYSSTRSSAHATDDQSAAS
ncbi:hypothetical protein [Burkholderia gladioli]|uniref:hypothetical protein n=1 Tax=Burkholderia gladioli TaxID=28095 RepID=UPI00163E8287|nr:hypothetical protein [Burkholderia gladioli]